MKIAMLPVSDIDTMDKTFTPYDDTGFRSYLRDKYERTMDHLSKITTSTSKEFLNRSRRVFEEINSSSALRKTRAAIRAISNIDRSGDIYRPDDIDGFRTAGFRMQRFLMADPVIRKKYIKQQIDGYSHSYLDIQQGAVGEDHYDYRRVTNGVFMPEVTEDGETQYVQRQYFERLIDGDRELDVEEQMDMIDNWYMQRCLQLAGIDTTSLRGDFIT